MLIQITVSNCKTLPTVNFNSVIRTLAIRGITDIIKFTPRAYVVTLICVSKERYINKDLIS